MFKKTSNKRIIRNQDNRNSSFSYYNNRQPLTDNKRDKKLSTKNKSNPKFIHALPMYVSVLLIVVSIGYAMTLSSTPTLKIVNEAELSKQLQSDASEYDWVIKEELSQSISSKTKLTINTDQLQTAILSKIPQATDVAVTLPIISRSPVVYLRLAEPKAVLLSNEKQILLDEKGRAIAETEDSAKNLLKIIDRSGLIIKAGNQAIPKNQIDFMIEVKNQFAQKEQKIEYFELSRNANELLIKEKGVGFKGKFNLASEPRLQSGTYIATKRYLDKKDIVPKSYIDVRVEERAYYK